MKSYKSHKNFIIISQYFPPEIGGGSQRSIGFAEELRNLDLNVSVVTPFPTYLMNKDNIKTKFKLFEKHIEDGLTIYRTFVYASDRGSFLKRILYYLSFMFSSTLVTLFEVPQIDCVLTISPPLFTGVVGFIIKFFKSANFIFDVGDLWPESAIQLGFLRSPISIWLSEQLEKIIYNRSDSINVVTERTLTSLQFKHPRIKNINLVPNFVNTKIIMKKEKDSQLVNKYNLEGKMVFGYAGNLGSAQGMKIITEAARLTIENAKIVFIIIGDGIERSILKSEIMKYGLHNVLLIPPVNRSEISKFISLFDVMIIPLVKNSLFTMTVPSKLYESMAAEIPVLLCVDGEARSIIEKYNCGIFVEPENSIMLAEKIFYLYNNRNLIAELGKNGRLGAMIEFDREKIITAFFKSLVFNEKTH